MANFEDLLGKVIDEIDGDVGDEIVTFKTRCGKKYKMWHYQDCYENVALSEIYGDLDDVIGSPIIEAEVATNVDSEWDGSEDVRTLVVAGAGEPEWVGDSYTWTFYKLGSMKGFVVLRWLGESNGCYSEEVSFDLIN